MVDWTGERAGDGCGLWDGEWLCVCVCSLTDWGREQVKAVGCEMGNGCVCVQLDGLGREQVMAVGCGMGNGCVCVQLDGLLRRSVGSYVVGQYGR